MLEPESIFASLPEPPSEPGTSDRLFPEHEDPGNNALVNWSSSDWLLYASSYKVAGDVLVNQLPPGSGQQDTLVYPILFLYRHYLELHLKVTIGTLRRLVGESHEIPAGHKIEGLWQTLIGLHRQARLKPPATSLVDLGRLINEFGKIDPASTAFRYPVDMEGKPSLPGRRVINLRNVRDVIAKMDMLLGGFHSYVADHLQFKLNMEREMREG